MDGEINMGYVVHGRPEALHEWGTRSLTSDVTDIRVPIGIVDEEERKVTEVINTYRTKRSSKPQLDNRTCYRLRNTLQGWVIVLKNKHLSKRNIPQDRTSIRRRTSSHKSIQKQQIRDRTTRRKRRHHLLGGRWTIGNSTRSWLGRYQSLFLHLRFQIFDPSALFL
jgi:hypothetical protein